MKKIIFIIITLFLFSCSEKKEFKVINNKQKEGLSDININQDITLNNLNCFGVEKSLLHKSYGKPISVTYPDYECGSFSNENQNVKFEILHYQGFQFIGAEKDKYFLEEIDFMTLPENKVFKIGTIILNKKSDKENLLKEIDNNFDFKAKGNSIILPTNSDFQFTLEFKDEKLIKGYLEESC